jgi:drug/metabolite transporter (DMT)-like permease
MSDTATGRRTTGPSRETMGLLLGFIGVVIFGATLPMTHLALESFNPGFITLARAALASAAALLLLLALRRPFPRREFGSLFVAGLLLVFGFPVLSSLAMQTVPASHGGIVLGVLPLTTSIFAALIGGEKPSALFWACGVAGTALVVLFAIRDSGMTLSAGDGWLFLSALAASLGYVVSGKLARKMPGWEVISWALVATAPFSVAGALATWRPGFGEASPASILALLYLAFGSMFIGFFAWNMGLAMGGIARVSQVQLLQTFITLAIAAALLGEAIGLEALLFASAVAVIVAAGRRASISRG